MHLTPPGVLLQWRVASLVLGAGVGVGLCGVWLLGESARARLLRSTADATSSAALPQMPDDRPTAAARTSRLRTALEQRGVTLRRIPLALVVHEVLGISIMAGTFGLCYYLRIGKRLEPFFRSSSHQSVLEVQRWSEPPISAALRFACGWSNAKR